MGQVFVAILADAAGAEVGEAGASAANGVDDSVGDDEDVEAVAPPSAAGPSREAALGMPVAARTSTMSPQAWHTKVAPALRRGELIAARLGYRKFC